MSSNAEQVNFYRSRPTAGQEPPSPAALDPDLLRRAEQEGPYNLGESYGRGEWDCENLDQLLFEVFSAGMTGGRLQHYARVLRHLLLDRLTNPQSGDGAFGIGRVHYDLGNQLFTAMLDPSMTYTSGYWRTADTLEAAQRDKLELTCRKLLLEPGMRVLDIGCGWGNFAKFAAENFGVRVTGVTVSKNQAEFARRQCRGLPVEIILQDYRRIEGCFDRVVSIEMIEAVGAQNLKTFFKLVHSVLEPQGLFLLETISCDTVSTHSTLCLDQFLMWILKHIFPNGYLPRIDELADPGRDLFVIEDLHSFGPDYDRTLMSWAKNFDNGWEKIKDGYDEQFRRIWRFYLLSCAAAFRARVVQLYQIVYAKGGRPAGYTGIR